MSHHVQKFIEPWDVKKAVPIFLKEAA